MCYAVVMPHSWDVGDLPLVLRFTSHSLADHLTGCFAICHRLLDFSDATPRNSREMIEVDTRVVYPTTFGHGWVGVG